MTCKDKEKCKKRDRVWSLKHPPMLKLEVDQWLNKLILAGSEYLPHLVDLLLPL